MSRSTGRVSQPGHSQRCAVLYPAVAEAARRAGADAVGLVDVGGSVGFNLEVDRVGITYSNGSSLGEPASPAQVSARIVGRRGVPARAVPEVTTRASVDGTPLDLVLEAIAQVPARAVPVVLTTWALSRWSVARRQRFRDGLQQAAVDRAVAWVSTEGVGVAPGVPTLGDRPASGHSIIGLMLFDGAATEAEALGRCWSQGRMLSWLAEA